MKIIMKTKSLLIIVFIWSTSILISNIRAEELLAVEDGISPLMMFGGDEKNIFLEKNENNGQAERRREEDWRDDDNNNNNNNNNPTSQTKRVTFAENVEERFEGEVLDPWLQKEIEMAQEARRECDERAVLLSKYKWSDECVGLHAKEEEIGTPIKIVFSAEKARQAALFWYNKVNYFSELLEKTDPGAKKEMLKKALEAAQMTADVAACSVVLWEEVMRGMKGKYPEVKVFPLLFPEYLLHAKTIQSKEHEIQAATQRIIATSEQCNETMKDLSPLEDKIKEKEKIKIPIKALKEKIQVDLAKLREEQEVLQQKLKKYQDTVTLTQQEKKYLLQQLEKARTAYKKEEEFLEKIRDQRSELGMELKLTLSYDRQEGNRDSRIAGVASTINTTRNEREKVSAFLRSLYEKNERLGLAAMEMYNQATSTALGGREDEKIWDEVLKLAGKTIQAWEETVSQANSFKNFNENCWASNQKIYWIIKASEWRAMKQAVQAKVALSEAQKFFDGALAEMKDVEVARATAWEQALVSAKNAAQAWEETMSLCHRQYSQALKNERSYWLLLGEVAKNETERWKARVLWREANKLQDAMLSAKTKAATLPEGTDESVVAWRGALRLAQQAEASMEATLVAYTVKFNNNTLGENKSDWAKALEQAKASKKYLAEEIKKIAEKKEEAENTAAFLRAKALLSNAKSLENFAQRAYEEAKDTLTNATAWENATTNIQKASETYDNAIKAFQTGLNQALERFKTEWNQELENAKQEKKASATKVETIKAKATQAAAARVEIERLQSQVTAAISAAQQARENIGTISSEFSSNPWTGIVSSLEKKEECLKKAIGACTSGKEELAKKYKVEAQKYEQAVEFYNKAVSTYRDHRYYSTIPKGDRWYDAGLLTEKNVEVMVKAIEARESGKETLATSYKGVAGRYESAVRYMQQSASANASQRQAGYCHKEEHLYQMGLCFKASAEVMIKALEAQENGQEKFAASFLAEVKKYDKATEYMQGQPSNSWGSDMRSINIAGSADTMAKAIEARMNGKEALANSYTIEAQKYDRAIALNERAASLMADYRERESSYQLYYYQQNRGEEGERYRAQNYGKREGSCVLDMASSLLRESAEAMIKALEARENGQEQFATAYVEAATRFEKAAGFYQEAAQAYDELWRNPNSNKPSKYDEAAQLARNCALAIIEAINRARAQGQQNVSVDMKMVKECDEKAKKYYYEANGWTL